MHTRITYVTRINHYWKHQWQATSDHSWKLKEDERKEENEKEEYRNTAHGL